MNRSQGRSSSSIKPCTSKSTGGKNLSSMKQPPADHITTSKTLYAQSKANNATTKENPNLATYSNSGPLVKNCSDKQDSRSASAIIVHEETKNSQNVQKRKEGPASLANQNPNYIEWKDSKKPADINRISEKGLSSKTIKQSIQKDNIREREREEYKIIKVETHIADIPKNENTEKEGLNIDTTKKDSSYHQYRTIDYKINYQEKHYEFSNIEKRKGPPDSTSEFPYETAMLKESHPNPKVLHKFIDHSQEIIDNTIGKAAIFSENQRSINSLSKSGIAQENSDKQFQRQFNELKQENDKLKEEIAKLNNQICDLNQEKMRFEENTQNYYQSLQNENQHKIEQQNDKHNEEILNLKQQIWDLNQEKMRFEKNTQDCYKNLENEFNSKLSKSKEENDFLKLMYDKQWSEFNKEITDLKNKNSRLEVIIIQNDLFEEKEKFKMHVNNWNTQKNIIETQHSADILKLNNEKLLIQKEIEDLKATYRILSKTVVNNEKGDNSKYLDMKLKQCEKEIEDYKFQLRNSGTKVKIYYDGLIASLEEQITDLANLNSQLETELSAANMKLLENNIY